MIVTRWVCLVMFEFIPFFGPSKASQQELRIIFVVFNRKFPGFVHFVDLFLEWSVFTGKKTTWFSHTCLVQPFSGTLGIHS